MSTRGGEYIYSVLSNDAAITAIVGTSIYNASMIPETDTSLDTINFFTINPFQGGLEFWQRTWSINCRRKEEFEALDLADLVFTALNRKHIRVGSFDYFCTANILPVIPPANQTDTYNVPVDINIRRR